MTAPPLPIPWEYEDELTPAELREALSHFKPGKLTGKLSKPLTTITTGTPTPYEKPRPRTPMPILTPGEFAGGLVLAGAAYFAGRWWGRRRKRSQPTVKSESRYVLGAMALAV